jgi:ubiquinone/menaquinone biosynthesis C-methylase UbiE
VENFNRKQHWESIYQTRQLTEVSWYQPTPEISLELIQQFNVPLNAKIIDVGGGDSFLVDHLLNLGYLNITVLDISEAAIKRAKKRLGDRSKTVKWIIADAATFEPEETYDLWHDRAAFHFLTDEKEIESYQETASNFISTTGILLIGTFSDHGPKKCSGLVIRQYSEKSLSECFGSAFNKIKCFTTDHKTPSGSVQNFIFCSFRKR